MWRICSRDWVIHKGASENNFTFYPLMHFGCLSCKNQALQSRQMETQAVKFAYRFVKDSNVRQQYISKTKAMAQELRAAYTRGDLSPKQAAEMVSQNKIIPRVSGGNGAETPVR